jgi:hypothetical protein
MLRHVPQGGTATRGQHERRAGRGGRRVPFAAHGATRKRAERGLTRAGLISALVAAGVLGYLIVQSFTLEASTCEVCMSYHGHEMCRKVGASTIGEAREAAITNACAFLSSGVTDSMACQRQKPLSENCE